MTVSVRARFTPVTTQPKPRSIWGRLVQFNAVRRQRQHLLALDDHQLRDIGLTAAQAAAEARKPSWDAPEYWGK